MRDTRLKAAVLGLDERGQLLLEAAWQVEHFQILAVADKDTKLTERLAAKYKCAGYDDYRQLIIQNQFDCLLVAAGTYSCDEHIRTAMKKKINILKLAPPARNFAEAEEFVRLGEAENIIFAVANPIRFAQSFLSLREFLQQGRIEQISLISAACDLGGLHHPLWQTDPKLAGGGVLLQNCYEIIDQITWNFGVPGQVYSLNTNTAGDRQQRLYLTEDIAVVTMKFSDCLIGNLTTSKVFGPEQKFLKIYGKDKILTVTSKRLVISDALGQVVEESEFDDNELVWMTRLLQNFALSILSPDKNKLCSSIRENLKNMACIESAYLSARTGFPEVPGRILEMASAYAEKQTNTQPGPKQKK